MKAGRLTNLMLVKTYIHHVMKKVESQYYERQVEKGRRAERNIVGMKRKGDVYDFVSVS